MKAEVVVKVSGKLERKKQWQEACSEYGHPGESILIFMCTVKASITLWLKTWSKYDLCKLGVNGDFWG